MAITIYGASDDLIEIEGDVRKEFSHSSEDAYLGCSDGTLLRVAYTEDGTWRITPVHLGSSKYEKKEAVSADSDEYSDRVTLTGEIKWVVLGQID